MNLESLFGGIDIYLFDQLLRGRLTPGMRILDAGCGTGRNLVYLLQAGFEIFGADESNEAVASVRSLAARLAPHLPATNFHIEPVEHMSFPESFVEFVISSAVLHFARNDEHFWAMLRGTWRVLRPGGLMFCRLASSIGMSERLRSLGEGRFLLPDGTERYLVNEGMLAEALLTLEGTLVDPLKTTIVQGQRCMTTWVIRKPG